MKYNLVELKFVKKKTLFFINKHMLPITLNLIYYNNLMLAISLF